MDIPGKNLKKSIAFKIRKINKKYKKNHFSTDNATLLSSVAID